MKNLDSVTKKITEFPCTELSESSAKRITQHLLKKFSRDVARRALQQINAACNWAVERGDLEENPFKGNRIKAQKKRPKVDPFSERERDLIIAEFERDPYHQHYRGFVEFLFFTGCRTSEAVGLRWCDIERDFIKFCSPVVEGIRLSTTKTGEVRRLPINTQLRELIDSLHLLEVDSLEIFHSKSGGLILPNNFLRRHWGPVLQNLRIPYRPQYSTRHTFATLCLSKGESPAKVAQWLGISVSTLMKYYAGFIPGDIPEL